MYRRWPGPKGPVIVGLTAHALDAFDVQFGKGPITKGAIGDAAARIAGENLRNNAVFKAVPHRKILKRGRVEIAHRAQRISRLPRDRTGLR